MLMMITAASGPAMTSTRGRQRSASAPNASCDTELAIWKHIARMPATESDRPRWGISSGSIGAYMLL